MTEKQRLVKHLARTISSAVVLLIAIVIAANLFNDNPALLSLIFLISMIPVSLLAGRFGEICATYAEYRKDKSNGRTV